MWDWSIGDADAIRIAVEINIKRTKTAGTPALREANEPFLERVTRYFRKLFGELAAAQATKDGPILLVQVEHDWTCANDEQAERYLREVGRVIRECGVAVPLIASSHNLALVEHHK